MRTDKDAAGPEEPIVGQALDDAEMLGGCRYATCGNGHACRRCQRFILSDFFELFYKLSNPLVVGADVDHAQLPDRYPDSQSTSNPLPFNSRL
ncbi:MAG: hypothetical protein M5R42_10395 [Rhodocyclaceae bacterium]|nr:hypothetical protein [Rhodocyclaceae bacterium]